MPNYTAPTQEFINYKNSAIPDAVANTGDTAIIRNCLQTNHALNAQDQAFLTDRLNTMNYVDELVKEQNGQKHLPPEPITTANGLRLPDIPEEQQTSACGCWAMPIQMMLKSRGIEVPQSVIRTYRPQMTGSESAHMTLDETYQLNADAYSNTAWGAELVQRLLPNTVMKQKSYGTDEMVMNDDAEKLYKDDLRKSVTTALSAGSPVALLVGDHYRTVVGIDGDELILKDSLKPSPVPDERLSLDTLFADARSTKTQAVEITWIDDLRVEKGSVQTDAYLNNYPYVTKSGNKLSIDGKDFSAKQAGANNPLANDQYEDEKVFHSALNISRIDSDQTHYICTHDILPKTLDPNVVEIAPAVGAPKAEKTAGEDPEKIIPEAAIATAINDPDEDEPENEKVSSGDQKPDELDEMLKSIGMEPVSVPETDPETQELEALLADVSKPDPPAPKTKSKSGKGYLTNQEAEKLKQQLSDEYLKEEEPFDLSFLNEGTEKAPDPTGDEKEYTGFEIVSDPGAEKSAAHSAEPLSPAAGAQEGKLETSFSKQAAESPKAQTPEEKLPGSEPPNPAFEVLNTTATAEAPKTVKAPEPVQEAPKQPEPVQYVQPEPVKTAQPAPSYPPQQQNVNAMLDHEIGKYNISKPAYTSRFMREDIYPPQPSMVKELCKSFGSGLLGLVRKIPILGSIVGFFADVVNRAVESYDRMIEAIDAKKPFMAGEAVYDMAVFGAIKQAKKDPTTAAVFADPRFQKSLRQLAENDPDINYAATRNHSPEFYKKYMMNQKGFDKITANYMKKVNKAISAWKDINKKYELNLDAAKKARAIEAARKKQLQKQQKLNQPKINNPSMSPK